jgi:hypothetical protein
MEYLAVPIEGPKPPRAEWPWMRVRDTFGEVLGTFQVWYMAVVHEPSGFLLERRWHPDMGEDREWRATSADGEFGLLGQARGLFRHSGRPPALRGPEEIRAVYRRLRRAAGRPPTTPRMARELGISTDTLRAYMARWDLSLDSLSTEKV